MAWFLRLRAGATTISSSRSVSSFTKGGRSARKAKTANVFVVTKRTLGQGA